MGFFYCATNVYEIDIKSIFKKVYHMFKNKSPPVLQKKLTAMLLHLPPADKIETICLGGRLSHVKYVCQPTIENYSIKCKFF